jgi:DNA topoisomerase-1
MQKNLVIVESPAKAKTIGKFLGDDYEVLSSYGHIRDLKKKEFSIDIKHDFCPKYEIPAEKKEVVSKLKAEAEKARMVWLASDEDREGEAISWHLYEVLKLKPETTKRIVFHEITKPAILNAIENPRQIDINLVNAQQARRVLDRIVGFELSPILWKKVKPALSAGRVQSVAVRLVVDKEREIQSFKSESSYRVVAIFLVPDEQGKMVELTAELARRLKTKEEAMAFLEKCKGANFTISDIVKRPVKRSPRTTFHHVDIAARSCPQARLYGEPHDAHRTDIIRIGTYHLYAYRLGRPLEACHRSLQGRYRQPDGREIFTSPSVYDEESRSPRGA